MKLYHGTTHVIALPTVKGSNEKNDYGPAFYVTENLTDAKMWACRHNEQGLVNCYFVSDERFRKLKILDLTNKKKYSVLNWLAILMYFRDLSTNFIHKNQEALNWLMKYYIDVDEYDVVIGYRADDAYFRFPREFVESNLAYEDLKQVYQLGKLGVQIAFISEKAIKLLKHKKIIECETTFKNAYLKNTIAVTKQFDVILNAPRNSKKHYMIDLLRGKYEPK